MRRAESHRFVPHPTFYFLSILLSETVYSIYEFPGSTRKYPKEKCNAIFKTSLLLKQTK